jgi:hypothetical protein
MAQELSQQYRDGLPVEVVGRIQDELPERGTKIVQCVQTAELLMNQAATRDDGGRLAASGAYNLREALEAVVAGRGPAPDPVPLLIDTWTRYRALRGTATPEQESLLATLIESLDRLADNRSHRSYHANQLLAYLQEKTGLDAPLDGLDPIAEYTELRTGANRLAHGTEASLAEAAQLLDQATAWFVRMFTPPDAAVRRINDIASQPWRDGSQIAELRSVASNQHHLRLFLMSISDPAWLPALYDAKLIGPPRPVTAQPWPLRSLATGLGTSAPEEVAALLGRVMADVRSLPPEQYLAARFEVLQLAVHLGPSGHTVAAEIVRLHCREASVRMFGAMVAQSARPDALVVAQIADAVLDGRRGDGDRYHDGVLLERLRAGITPENCADRAHMVIAKVRRLAQDPSAYWGAQDSAALTAELGNQREALVQYAHHLAHLLQHARELGHSTTDLLSWMHDIPGTIRERIICQVLAKAPDVPLRDKINHVTFRIASPVATGDDLALVEDILSYRPAVRVLAEWRTALGEPTAAIPEQEQLPEDWARAWRWSAILPPEVLAGWDEQIGRVTDRHGQPDLAPLRHRIDLTNASAFYSPYSTADLAERSVLEAALLVGAWRPAPTRDWMRGDVEELASTLDTAVGTDLAGWTREPAAVVSALGGLDSIYVLRYLRTLRDRAADIVDYADQILAATRLTSTSSKKERTGADGELAGGRPDPTRVSEAEIRVAALEMAAAFAHRNADLTAHLDDLWRGAIAIATAIPAGETRDRGLGLLTNAINQDWGRAWDVMFALAGWEMRRTGGIRADFEQALDVILAASGDSCHEGRFSASCVARLARDQPVPIV